MIARGEQTPRAAGPTPPRDLDATGRSRRPSASRPRDRPGGTALHAEEHALIDDLLLAEALDRARDAEDELAADWARHTARSRHATPRRDTPGRTVLRPAR